MAHLIDKDVLVAEIEKLKGKVSDNSSYCNGWQHALRMLELSLDTLEVIDPYEQLIQYPSREDGIKAHAEDYSWNIESELFQQLTPEQQKLWRKEIEQACISGGYSGLNLAKDLRYEKNSKVKEVDLEKELNDYGYHYDYVSLADRKELVDFAKHFFELGLKAQKEGKV